MNYIKLIELYLGRKFSFYDIETKIGDIYLRNDGDGLYIHIWNITDKPQPTIAELEALQPQVEIEENNDRVYKQIAEIDNKRSRAFFEPSEKETGLSWLEFYNREIAKLREQIKYIYD